MRTTRLTLIAMVWLLTVVARAQTTNYTYSSGTVNATIPDGDPVGLTENFSMSGVYGYISTITVSLDISGGFNGDLYAYLAGPNGQFAVLLNRTGMSSTNSFGYSDTGFNITLDMSSANIHNYQLGGAYNLNGNGQLTGTWGADGRTVDSLTQSASDYDSAAVTAGLNTYYGTLADGTWTLYIADLSGNNVSTLVNWGVTITTSPEPQTWAMLAGGAVMLLGLRRKR